MKLEYIKGFIRVDYDDDDEYIQLMYNATLQEMGELIEDFNAEEPTYRQQLLILTTIKELYDNREKRTTKPELLRAAISSMLIKEMYK